MPRKTFLAARLFDSRGKFNSFELCFLKFVQADRLIARRYTSEERGRKACRSSAYVEVNLVQNVLVGSRGKDAVRTSAHASELRLQRRRGEIAR
jgi:coproporphyrinogen III oxidase